MYNVVEDLYSLNTINIIDPYKKEIIKVAKVKGSIIKLYDNKIRVREDKFNYKWNKVYNNITLYNDELDSKLIILQDYGDYEGEVPNDFLEINRAIPFTDINTSIGWYDNHLVLISSYDEMLYVYKLCLSPEIDISRLNDKRPYSFKVMIPKEYTLETDLYIFIRFKLKNDEYKGRLVSIPMTFKDVTTPQNLNEVVDNRIIEKEYKAEYLTRDDLVVNSFCYDSLIKCWKKDGLRIFDDGKPFSGLNLWIQKDSESIALYSKKDLEKLLK